MYLRDGIKIHVRQIKAVLVPQGVKDDRLTVRPTLSQMRDLGIRHYKGSQYRYIYFLCNRTERKRLTEECLESLTIPRPKDDDLTWRVRDVDKGVWVECGKPPYITDFEKPSLKQMTIDEWMGAQ